VNLHFTYGDKATAIDIMREAARWLIDSGKPMWSLDELADEAIVNPPEEFVVLWDGEESAAAMTLSYVDELFWPEIPPGTSGFIHKLSVRRKYAGKGLAALLVEHGKQICADKGLRFLRLDCDPHREGLMSFYKACGFSLVEIKVINAYGMGKIDLAMFEMDCLAYSGCSPSTGMEIIRPYHVSASL
jgi:GNAT superfamily N-acetyltransferase